MFSSSCCGFCGLVSFLGVIFYLTCAVMLSRRNLVFIEHKMHMDMFTMTESEINEKFWMIMCVSFVSVFVVIRFSPYLQL